MLGTNNNVQNLLSARDVRVSRSREKKTILRESGAPASSRKARLTFLPKYVCTATTVCAFLGLKHPVKIQLVWSSIPGSIRTHGGYAPYLSTHDRPCHGVDRQPDFCALGIRFHSICLISGCTWWVAALLWTMTILCFLFFFFLPLFFRAYVYNGPCASN